MKNLKIVFTLASCLLITLFSLFVLGNDPEANQYKKTVEILMERDGLISEKDVLNCYPALFDLKKKMEIVARLDDHIKHEIRQPIAAIPESERLELIGQIQQERQLRIDVRAGLKMLTTFHAIVYP